MITEALFNEWLESLSEHGKMNFRILIGLSEAQKFVDKMPEGGYKDMANYALSNAKH